MNGSNVDTEHRTLTADGCFAQCEDLEDVEAVKESFKGMIEDGMYEKDLFGDL